MIETDDRVFLGQRIVSYRADRSQMLPRFLLYTLRSSFLINQFNNLASGATVKHIRVPQSKELKIPVCELKLQEKVANTLQAVESHFETILVKNRKKTGELDNLRQSLLAKAFAGELT